MASSGPILLKNPVIQNYIPADMGTGKRMAKEKERDTQHQLPEMEKSFRNSCKKQLKFFDEIDEIDEIEKYTGP